MGIVLMSLFVIGEGFVVLLVARRSVPRELYELAAVEGGSAFAVFRRLTLPLMAPVLILLFCRDVIFSLQATFVPALVVTDGGPAPYATTYVPLFVYRNAFEYLRYGYASSAVVVMFVLTAPDRAGAVAGAAPLAARRHGAVGSRARPTWEAVMATPQLLDLNGTYTTDSLGQIFLNVPALDVTSFEKIHFEILQWPQMALQMTVRCAIGKTRPPGDTLAQWVAEFPLSQTPHDPQLRRDRPGLLDRPGGRPAERLRPDPGLDLPALIV